MALHEIWYSSIYQKSQENSSFIKTRQE